MQLSEREGYTLEGKANNATSSSVAVIAMAQRASAVYELGDAAIAALRHLRTLQEGATQVIRDDLDSAEQTER